MKLIPEWKNHSHCLIAWPCNYDLYKDQIKAARIEVANLANQISEEEEVIIYCNTLDFKDCENIISNNKINVIEAKLDDSWMRDIAPIFYKDDSKLKTASFNFNGYGKYPNFENDNKISEIISQQFKLKSTQLNITLEGGAITYDDKGNLFTTESVLLNPNRDNENKKIIEHKLIELFDLNKIIWFPDGLEEDDTDGHIDNILAPVGDSKYLLACSKQEGSHNSKTLNLCKEILEKELISQDIKSTIIEIPLPSEVIINGNKLVASYINFYFTKDSIYMPKFNVKEDEVVYDIFQSVFFEKKIKMLDTRNINYGGGNIHCITMNIPQL